MVACSALEDAIGARLTGSAAGVLTGAGRGAGSGVALGGTVPVWLGFHIALKMIFLFCPLQGRGVAKAKGTCLDPNQYLVNGRGATFPAPAGDHLKIASPSWSAKMLRLHLF